MFAIERIEPGAARSEWVGEGTGIGIGVCVGDGGREREREMAHCAHVFNRPTVISSS